MAEARVGDRLGAFELAERIGGGGNADVFRATSDRGSNVALKVLRSRRVDSEPYSRFRREIDTLRTLGERPGILPLLDAHLPEISQGASEPGWRCRSRRASTTRSPTQSSTRSCRRLGPSPTRLPT